jgi:hypothetical protein
MAHWMALIGALSCLVTTPGFNAEGQVAQMRTWKLSIKTKHSLMTEQKFTTKAGFEPTRPKPYDF